MKIYADENIEEAIVKGLRRRGVEIGSARELGHAGKNDELQLQHAKKTGAVILTHDADLLSIAHRWSKEGQEHHGFLYIHIQDLSIGECIRRVDLVVHLLAEEDIERNDLDVVLFYIRLGHIESAVREHLYFGHGITSF